MNAIIKEKLNNLKYIYGPLTKEEAFGVNIPSFAIVHEGNWYAGTSQPYSLLDEKFIDIPDPEPIVEQTIEQPTE